MGDIRQEWVFLAVKGSFFQDVADWKVLSSWRGVDREVRVVLVNADLPEMIPVVLDAVEDSSSFFRSFQQVVNSFLFGERLVRPSVRLMIALGLPLSLRENALFFSFRSVHNF